MPFWAALASGLPITLCMLLLGLPEMNRDNALAYRALYIAAYLVSTLPLAQLQRLLWRRGVRWPWMVVSLLLVTYALSLAANALVIAFAVRWGQLGAFQLALVFRDSGSWFGLITFCAIHAVVTYATRLRQAEHHALLASASAREAELRALRYQLNPHFLFNSINAVSALIASGAPREANQVLARLSDFLRATLQSAQLDEITVGEEIGLITTYLDVEKARLGARLQVRLQLGPGVMHARIPYLLLQPLVENAIAHGIALRRQPGTLQIDIARLGANLSISVTNDGVPRSPCEPATGRHSTGLGQANIRSRLQGLYPATHRFATQARDDGRYRVEIELPFLATQAIPAEPT